MNGTHCMHSVHGCETCTLIAQFQSLIIFSYNLEEAINPILTCRFEFQQKDERADDHSATPTAERSADRQQQKRKVCACPLHLGWVCSSWRAHHPMAGR